MSDIRLGNRVRVSDKYEVAVFGQALPTSNGPCHELRDAWDGRTKRRHGDTIWVASDAETGGTRNCSIRLVTLYHRDDCKTQLMAIISTKWRM